MDASITVGTSASKTNYNKRIPRTEPLDLGMGKTCRDCGETKDRDAFHDNWRLVDGLASYCKTCATAHTRISRGVHPDDAYRQAPPNQQCEICGDDGGKRGLFLDHNHSTGRFRGWLCHTCNSAIGRLDDSHARLLAAITYLERSRR